MSIQVETPPCLTGTPEQQLGQTYSYLFRLAEYLNVALNGIPSVSAGADTMTPSVGMNDQQRRQAETYNELRALIVNTAELTRTEMDRLETHLQGSYEALSSQWGGFRENLGTQITATARDVVQNLNYASRLDALDDRAAGFEAYQIRSEGYIRSGFIDYDGNGVPIVGIAIGQNLTSTTVTIGGRNYEQLNRNQSCAFYTADKVSFRINGTEVAYVSNKKLYIHDVEITGNVVLNSKWMLAAAGGLRIKWIGG